MKKLMVCVLMLSLFASCSKDEVEHERLLSTKGVSAVYVPNCTLFSGIKLSSPPIGSNVKSSDNETQLTSDLVNKYYFELLNLCHQGTTIHPDSMIADLNNN